LHESDNSCEIKKIVHDRIIAVALPQCTRIYK